MRAAITVAACAFALLCLTGTLWLGQGIASTITPPTIAEDSAQWDCATMGNRVCGVDGYLIQYRDGVPVSVTAK